MMFKDDNKEEQISSNSMIDMNDVALKAFVYYDEPTPFPLNKARPWVALFIDGDGLQKDVKIKEVLKKSEELGEVVVRRIFGNYHVPRGKTQWKKIYDQFSFDRRIYLGVHKNIADHGIVAEMVELALTVPPIDYYVLVSHDGGFFPLMAKMAQLGKKVYWIGGLNPLKKVEQLKEEVDQNLQAIVNSSDG